MNGPVRWVKVSIDPRSSALQVDSNAGFAEAVALLEVGKTQLIANGSRAPTSEQLEGDAPIAAARIPSFRPPPLA